MESWGENQKGSIRTQLKSTLGSLTLLANSVLAMRWAGYWTRPSSQLPLLPLLLTVSPKSKFYCNTSGRDTTGLSWGCHTFMSTIYD